MSVLLLMVYSVAIEMSGEIHNRVEDLPKNFSLKKSNTEEISDIENVDDSKTKIVPLSCDICKVKVTSSKIFQRHLDGRKHKLRAERQGKIFKCDLCDIIANSEIQLEIHIKSARHKAKLHKKEHPHFSLLTSYVPKNYLIVSFLLFLTFFNLSSLFK